MTSPLESSHVQDLIHRLIASVITTGPPPSLSLPSVEEKHPTSAGSSRKTASVLHSLKYHRFPDTNSHSIRNRFKGLLEKLQIQNETLKLNALKRYYDAYVRILEEWQTTRAQTDDGFGVLDLLLALSNSPTHGEYRESSVARQTRAAAPEEFKEQLLADLVEDLTDWHQELRHLDEDDFDVQDKDRPEQQHPDTQTPFETTASISARTPQPPPAAPAPADSHHLLHFLLQRYPYGDALRETVASPYWTVGRLLSTNPWSSSGGATAALLVGDSAQDALSSSLHATMSTHETLAKWGTSVALSGGLHHKPPCVTLSEYHLMREILWVLQGAHASFAFESRSVPVPLDSFFTFWGGREHHVRCQSVSPRATIAARFLSPAACGSMLSDFAALRNKIEVLQSFADWCLHFHAKDESLSSSGDGDHDCNDESTHSTESSVTPDRALPLKPVLPKTVQAFASFLSGFLTALSRAVAGLENGLFREETGPVPALTLAELSEATALLSLPAKAKDELLQQSENPAHMSMETLLANGGTGASESDLRLFAQSLHALSDHLALASSSPSSALASPSPLSAKDPKLSAQPTSATTIISLRKRLQPWARSAEILLRVLVEAGFLHRRSGGPAAQDSDADGKLQGARFAQRLLDSVYHLHVEEELLHGCGDRAASSFAFSTRELFTCVAEPYLHLVDEWLVTGKLHDPRGELHFACNMLLAPTDAAFWEEYVLVKTDGVTAASNVPCPEFLTPSAARILLCGKTARFSNHLASLEPGVDGDQGPPSRRQLRLADLLHSSSADGGGAGPGVVDLEARALERVTELEHEASAKLMQQLACFSPRSSSLSASGSAGLRAHDTGTEIVSFIFHARQVYLMESGGVMHDFCTALFDQILKSASEQNSDHWRRGYFLTGLLHDSFGTELSHLCAYFSISTPDLDDDKDGAGGVGMDETDSIRIRFNIPWPFSIAFDDASMRLYHSIFRFLVRIKRSKWMLDSMRPSRSLLSRSVSYPRDWTATERRLLLVRQKLAHFVNSVHSYLMTRILHSVGLEYDEPLRSATSLDELLRLHRRYLLTVFDRCFLHSQLKVILDVITKVLEISALFHAQWSRFAVLAQRYALQYAGPRGSRAEHDGESFSDNDGSDDDAADEQSSSSSSQGPLQEARLLVGNLDAEFEKCSTFIVSLLRNVAARGAYPHLEALAFTLAKG